MSVVMSEGRLPRRLKKVAVSRELLEQLLTTGHRLGAVQIVDGVPAGAQLRSAEVYPNPWITGKFNDPVQDLHLVFEHESFPEIDFDQEPEMVNIIVRELAPFPSEASV